MKKTLTLMLVLTTAMTVGMAVYIFKIKQNTLPPIVEMPPQGPINPVTPVPPQKEHTYEEALASIQEDSLKKDLYHLASQELEGRMTGKKGNVVAAEYIKKKFEDAGLNVMYHKFTSQDIGRSIRGVNPGPNREQGDDFSQNIYAWIEGNDPQLKNEIIVIGAHMDHIGYGPSMSRSRKIAVHPGADDNASGTVALIEIAEAFALLKGKVKRTVIFQAYSAEEMGLLGSRFYCNSPTFPKGSPSIKSHVFMLNMDMVGYLGKGTYQVGFHNGESSVDISAIISDLNRKYSFANKITGRRSGGSDHASFYNKGVPIAFLHTGGHPYYHTPDDTPDRINYDGIEQVAKYGFELAWRVAQGDDKPRFAWKTFAPMDYVHDHGNPDTPFLHPWHHDHDHPHDHPHPHGKED